MKSIVAVLCIVFTARAYGQTTTITTDVCQCVPLLTTAQSKLPDTLPGVGVVIESWHYDPAQKTVTLHLVNRSNKTATAWSISMAVTYADGSTNPWYADGIPHKLQDSQRMEDELNLFIRPEARRGRSVFAAGTTRDYAIPDGGQKIVASIEAVVDVVAYADGTADVLDNDRALQNLVAVRKGPLMAMEKTTEIIKRVLADPMVSSPTAEVLRVLTPLADVDPTKNRPLEDPAFHEAFSLQNDVRNLEMMQKSQRWLQMNMTEREWLTQYVEQQEKQIALWSPHANLVPTLYGPKTANQ